jgi:hypothetical protein
MMSTEIKGPLDLEKEVIKAVHDLEDLNIKVVSTWHKESHKPSISMKAMSDSFCRKTAKRDIKELKSADTFVLLSVDPDVKFSRGGHCIEAGWAQALRLRFLLVGPKQNVFCYLPGIKRVKTWEAGKKWLAKQITPTIGQYSDYINISELIRQTTMDDWSRARPLPKRRGKKIRMFKGVKCPKGTRRPRKTTRSSKKPS